MASRGVQRVSPPCQRGTGKLALNNDDSHTNNNTTKDGMKTITIDNDHAEANDSMVKA